MSYVAKYSFYYLRTKNALRLIKYRAYS